MTFPVVAATNTSTQTASTTHTVNLPASISSGDLLVVFFNYNSATDEVTTPVGWTQFINAVNNIRLYGFYKVADGGEGATLSVTSANALVSRHNSYRITGYQSTPEAATATGSSNTPDPPNLTPSWGAADTLWLAAAFMVNGSPDAGAPTNYTNLLEAFLASIEMISARRELNAASENPGTFTNGNNDVWAAATIAIQPAAAGAAGKMDNYRRRRAA